MTKKPTGRTEGSFRIKPIWVLTIIGLGFAIHILLPQVGQLSHTLEELKNAEIWWLVLVLIATLATFVSAAIALRGASSKPLKLWRTTVVQVVASFVNRLAPGGIGGFGLNARYLEKEGLSRGAATGVIGTNAAAAAAVHAGMLLAAAVLSGQEGLTGRARMPDGWPFLLAGVVTLVLMGLLFFPSIRARLVKPTADALAELWSTIRSPLRGLQLLGGCIGVNVAYIAALGGSLAAYDASAPFAHVALAYLVSAMIASAAPTPGGLGAMEAALVATLTALGVESAPAVAGVLTFRLATFWLPILPGWLALRSLRRQALL